MESGVLSTCVFRLLPVVLHHVHHHHNLRVIRFGGGGKTISRDITKLLKMSVLTTFALFLQIMFSKLIECSIEIRKQLFDDKSE